jgi:hypothetical protein
VLIIEPLNVKIQQQVEKKLCGMAILLQKHIPEQLFFKKTTPTLLLTKFIVSWNGERSSELTTKN